MTGAITRVTDEIGAPNGLCFSPDYDRLYVADSGSGQDVKVWDVDGERLVNGRRLVQLSVPGDPAARSIADGMRCDADGNSGQGRSPACRSSPRTAMSSASSGCPSVAPTSASAAPGATGCS